MDFNCLKATLKATEPTRGDSLILTTNSPGGLIWSTSEEWKAESTLELSQKFLYMIKHFQKRQKFSFYATKEPWITN